MSYVRVLPRDAFNEAKLLKCVAKLTLLIEDRMNVMKGWAYSYDGAPFDIQQDESDGSIEVANIEFLKDGKIVHVFTPINSKRPWPACALGAGYDFDALFDDDGNIAQT